MSLASCGHWVNNCSKESRIWGLFKIFFVCNSSSTWSLGSRHSKPMLCWVSNIPSTFNIMNDITNNQIKAVQWQKKERNKIIRDYQFNYFGRWLLPQVFHKSSNFHFHFLTLRPLRQADEKQNYPGRDMACRVTSLIERTLLMSTLTKILTILPISSGGGALS